MSKKFRRIITGENDSGNSCILSDEPSKNNFGLPGVLDIYPLWESCNELRIPFKKENVEQGVKGNGKLLPGIGGSKFMIEVAWPDKPNYNNDDAKKMFESLGSESALMENDGSAPPGMHRTDSVDYIVVLSGSITMILDSEEVLLNEGDIVVQGGVAHTWRNKSSSPCILLAVVLGALRA